MAIVLQEGLRAVFYAPFYAALALGAYDAEGIAARLVSSPSPGQTPYGLFARTVVSNAKLNLLIRCLPTSMKGSRVTASPKQTRSQLARWS